VGRRFTDEELTLFSAPMTPCGAFFHADVWFADRLVNAFMVFGEYYIYWI